MSILESVALGQLETFKHLLQELEIESVMDLPTARRIVEQEVHTRHVHLRRSRVKKTEILPTNLKAVFPKMECKECGRMMEEIKIDSDTNRRANRQSVNVFTVLSCSCGYSNMVS